MKLTRLGAAGLLLAAALALTACSVDVEGKDDSPSKKAADAPADTGPAPEESTSASDQPDLPGLPEGAGEAIVVNGNGSNDTSACGGKNVIVNGNLNNVSYTGSCRTVTVNGNDNKVTVDQVTAVIFNGSRNKLTYKQGDPKVIDNDGSNDAAAG
jgi:hypothetical protein